MPVIAPAMEAMANAANSAGRSVREIDIDDNIQERFRLEYPAKIAI